MNTIIKENYNSKNLVSMWRDFIDWEKRRQGEDGFLVKQLKENNVEKVFDSCLGDGCDSIFLIKEGFEVIGNEIDQSFLEKAISNAKENGIVLNYTSYDWLELGKHFPKESFNAVTCLGNSITYIFNENDRLEIIKQFKQLLKPGGILLIDERNYQYILDNKQEVLSGHFNYSGKYVYCGTKVHGQPIEISNNKIKMEYTGTVSSKKGYLTLYPFKRGELKKILEKAGFSNIEQFSDYKPGYKDRADFYQYICTK